MHNLGCICITLYCSCWVVAEHHVLAQLFPPDLRYQPKTASTHWMVLVCVYKRLGSGQGCGLQLNFHDIFRKHDIVLRQVAIAGIAVDFKPPGYSSLECEAIPESAQKAAPATYLCLPHGSSNDNNTCWQNIVCDATYTVNMFGITL